MKLFNKQRFKLMKSKQFQKYILYATGEIILVIIGILIALWINTMSQENKLRSDNVDLQKKVLEQIDKDLLVIEAFQKDIDTINQIYRRVLNREYDTTKVKTGAIITSMLFEVNTLSLDRHFNNLVDNAKLDDSQASKEIIDINSMYKLYLKSVDDIEAIIFKRMTDNLAEIEKTQDWYVELITDFVCRNDCISYLLNDDDHKSRIASSRFLVVSGYGGIIDSFHEDLIEAKAKLERVIAN
ncbi:hypothetical protein [uncultured Psychroserpens sp.]|uniref:hypothetical protein n=1 Tax=uncultured Psychroserpens sp. TaxID=255436 RepID=UPI00260F4592|nr:hypothetical protein [uncultured Psychroserpens sp.]